MIETFIQDEMLEEELNVIKKIISSTNLNIVDCLNRFVKDIEKIIHLT